MVISKYSEEKTGYSVLLCTADATNVFWPGEATTHFYSDPTRHLTIKRPNKASKFSFNSKHLFHFIC